MDILLADDSSVIHKVIAMSLSNLYNCKEVLSFEHLTTELESRYKASTTENDFCDELLVICSGHLSGLKTVHQLKKLGSKYHNTKFIILIGSFDSINQSDFIKAGFTNILKKPFSEEQIIRLVSSVVKKTPFMADDQKIISQQNPQPLHSPQISQNPKISEKSPTIPTTSKPVSSLHYPPKVDIHPSQDNLPSISQIQGGTSDPGDLTAMDKRDSYRAKANNLITNENNPSKSVSSIEQACSLAKSYIHNPDSIDIDRDNQSNRNNSQQMSGVGSDTKYSFSDDSLNNDHHSSKSDHTNEYHHNNTYRSDHQDSRLLKNQSQDLTPLTLTPLQLNLLSAEVFARIKDSLSIEIKQQIEQWAKQGLDNQLKNIIKNELRDLADQRSRL